MTDILADTCREDRHSGARRNGWPGAEPDTRAIYKALESGPGKMDLRQVRYFLAVCETKNFTRAARICDVTQPTLTVAIKKLEQELGGPLLHRERENTHLTRLGETVLPFLQQVYESSTAACRLAREIADGRRVPLSFGVSDVIRKSVLLQPLRDTGLRVNGLELHVEGGADADLVRRLEGGALHLALVDGSAIDGDKLRFHPIYAEEFGVLMPEDDPLAGHNRVTPEDLVRRPWIALNGSGAHESLAAMLGGVAAGWTPKHRVTRPTEAQILCQSGMGLSLVGGREPLLSGLVSRKLAEPELTRVVGVAEARGRPLSDAALSFVRLLRAQSPD